jgi:hypothetical protein
MYADPHAFREDRFAAGIGVDQRVPRGFRRWLDRCDIDLA